MKVMCLKQNSLSLILEKLRKNFLLELSNWEPLTNLTIMVSFQLMDLELDLLDKPLKPKVMP